MKNYKIIFTNHAFTRLQQAGITVAQAREYLQYATKEKKNGRFKDYKNEKYGHGGQDQAGLYSFGMHLFTVVKKVQDDEKVAIVITYSFKPNNNWFSKRPNGRKRHNND